MFSVCRAQLIVTADPSLDEQALDLFHLQKKKKKSPVLVIDSSDCPLVTGPVARFARQIAGQGYICAAPSTYHEFMGPEALNYDAEDTDKGNLWKTSKVRLARTPTLSHAVVLTISMVETGGL